MLDLVVPSLPLPPWAKDVNGILVVVAVWGMAAAIGIAVLRYRLYDIDRIVNRTLVYGLLTVLLGGVYAGIVLVLGQLFGSIGGQPPTGAVAGATLAVAALFQPAPAPHPSRGGPAVQPSPLRCGQDRRGLQRPATRPDRPRHPRGRVAGGGRPDHAADHGVAVASAIGEGAMT
jgi:hypothetical protein